MNFYQAGYTRRGRQGEGAGWSIVSPSEEMSQIAKEGFSGIAGNLAELVSRFSMPKQAVGVFCHDRFWYYLQINYAVDAEEAKDARGVSFVHGYSFNLSDYYELCKNPEMLCGITDQTFQDRYDDSVKSYPVVHQLPHSAMDFTQLMEKYRLSVETYRRLLIGATCALEGYADSLCIKISCPLEEYRQVCQEVMYLILHGLPYHLRSKLTFFSYKGGKTTIYFNEKTEGNNYFDLDKRVYVCDKRRLEKYQFTQIYNLADDQQRQMILQIIADFIDQVFDIPLKEMNCEQIEHGFQAKLKNLFGKAIDPDRIMGLLTSFMGFRLKESEATEDYLTELLDLLNWNNQMMEDSHLLQKITNYAQRHSANGALQEAYRRLYARQILAGDRQEGYRILLKQYKEDERQHNALLEAICEIDGEYGADYYERILLPERLNSLTNVIAFLKQNGDTFELNPIFYSLLQKVTNKEMKESKSFKEQLKVRKKANKAADQIALSDRKYAQSYRLFTDYTLWNCFAIAWFSPADIEDYKNCSLDQLASYKGHEISCETAKTVKKLMQVYQAIRLGDGKGLCYQFFFTDSIVSDIAVKKVMQDVIQKNCIKADSPNTKNRLDLLLVCCYDLGKKEFDVLGWGMKIKELGYDEIFEWEQIEKFVKSSAILEDRKLRKTFVEASNELLKDYTWRKRKDFDKEVKQGLKRYADYLTGKKRSYSREAEEQERFQFTLHKMAVGYLPLVSTAFFLICLNRYGDVSEKVILAVGAVCAVLLIGTWIFKIVHGRGVGDYLYAAGITKVSRLVVVLLVGVGLVLSAGAAGFFWKKFPASQQELSYRKTEMGLIVLGVYVGIAIISAVFESLGEDKKRKKE